MNNEINKIICDAINTAVENKFKQLNKDITYICTIIEKDKNRYKLSYKNVTYDVILSNISPNLYEKVHLVIPQGNFKNKYVLEDIVNSSTSTSCGGGSSIFNFEIRNGDLIMHYIDGQQPPTAYINTDGELIMTI